MGQWRNQTLEEVGKWQKKLNNQEKEGQWKGEGKNQSHLLIMVLKTMEKGI